jgi:hypothetical protein
MRFRTAALVVALAASGCSTFTPQSTPSRAVVPATKITRSGSSGVLTTLYSFRGQPDGANPTGSVSAYNFGSCCGTRILGNTSSGGANNAGTIYMLFAPNNGSFTEYTLLNYTPSVDGSGPRARLQRPCPSPAFLERRPRAVSAMKAPW